MSLKDSSIIKKIISFSITEKIVFYFFVIIFLTTGIGIILKQTDFLFVSVPAYGGTINEGIVGSPRYVNPVLNVTEAGKDISSLIFSGLLKENGDGTLSPDLADNYTVSPDGLVYDVYLKNDLTFHDGKALTADDVLFTIDKIKDINIKSPEYINWQGVTASKIDDNHIQFNLKSPFAPFAHNLTIGIIPKHIWQNVSDDQFSFSAYNYEPIGSGPYQFTELKRDQNDLPLYYKLKAFKKYADGQAYIQNINFYFYKDIELALNSLRDGKINSLGGISYDDIKDFNIPNDEEIRTYNLLRTFSVFLNQSQSEILINKEVRQALDESIDRKKMIDTIVGGYGIPEYSPIPAKLLSSESLNNEISATSTEDENLRIAEAKEILTDNGWKLNDEGIMEKGSGKSTTTLSFTLSTSDNEGLKKTAEFLKDAWSKIGAKVEIVNYDATTLNQNVIRPRKYEALLFGEVLGHDADLYPFWHSSQRNDPGLNVAMYTNVKADKALEKERSATSIEDRTKAYMDFNNEIMKDIPAVFLYSPQYIYIVPKKLQGFSLDEIENPFDRFNNIEMKYIETKKVLKIFNRK